MTRLTVTVLAGAALVGVGLVVTVLAVVVRSDGDDGPVVAPRSRLPAAEPDRSRLAAFGEARVTVDPPAGPAVLGCLLLAATAEQRAQGLMGVTDLGGYDGMAFEYAADTTGAFYMRATPTPLSIAWIDAGGAEVDRADMTPCADRADCPLYRPSAPYRLAVEVPRGRLGDLGLVPGARVTVGGACEP